MPNHLQLRYEVIGELKTRLDDAYRAKVMFSSVFLWGDPNRFTFYYCVHMKYVFAISNPITLLFISDSSFFEYFSLVHYDTVRKEMSPYHQPTMLYF